MRELKFRAWDTEEKSYVKDPILFDNFVNVYVVCEKSRTERGTCLITGKPNVIFEQYIGLKDKNDKYIYEGDIVLVDNRDYSPYIVVYREWDCSFIGENDDREEIVRICNKTPQRYEVIGNIHENSELIGGK